MKAGYRVEVIKKPFTSDPEVGSVGRIKMFDGEDYLVEFENWDRGWGETCRLWFCSSEMLKVID